MTRAIPRREQGPRRRRRLQRLRPAASSGGGGRGGVDLAVGALGFWVPPVSLAREQRERRQWSALLLFENA